jgi:HlyD family secretion protein
MHQRELQLQFECLIGFINCGEWVAFGMRALGIVLLLIVLGAGGYFGWQYYSAGSADSVKFVTAKVERGDINQLAQANGTINPVSVINVGTQISGVVKKINADFNQTVEQGQILAELDTRVLEAALAQSRAQLRKARAAAALAKVTLERKTMLVADGAASKADVDLAAQQVEATAGDQAIAEASVRRDEANLGFAVVSAPVSGVILSRDVDVGQTVAASFQTPTLFKIAPSLKNMQIDTNLSEADAGSIVEGQKAAFTVDAFSGRTFEGVVRQIRLNPTTVQNVVTYDVVVDVSNDDLKLLPGMTAFVRIRVGDVHDVLKVPNQALRYKPKSGDRKGRRSGGSGGGGGQGGKDSGDAPVRLKAGVEPQRVYILSHGKPKKVIVKTGLTDGKFTEIKAGELKPSDEVITGEEQPQKGAQRSGGFGGQGGGGPRF